MRYFGLNHRPSSGVEKAKPIRRGLRGVPHEHIGVIKNEMDKLQNKQSSRLFPFVSQTILVWKKDGTMRLCIDYRKLNNITKTKAHLLFRIEDIFNTLFKSKYFTTLDFVIRYHQVKVLLEDREKTAFSIPFGLFQYNVMRFGHATAPTRLMRLMTIVFSGMLYSTCLAYFNDIIIFGRTFEEHLYRLDQALKRPEIANFKLKLS